MSELILPIAIAAVGLMLACANGANDDFKGVATLLGSGTATYRVALAWATLTTAPGLALFGVGLAIAIGARPTWDCPSRRLTFHAAG